MKTINLDLILSNVIGVSVDYLLFKNEVQIVRPDEALKAMREACNRAIELCAEVQRSEHSATGFTCTGKKINDSILSTKSQII